MKNSISKIWGTISVLTALAACDYTPAQSQAAPGTEVGATGNIQYTFEELTPTRRFLTLTAAPGIGETESSISQRMYQFAVRFAATNCPNEYQFIDDPNMSQETAFGLMRRTRSYVFDCI
jgi:hypothetical protein